MLLPLLLRLSATGLGQQPPVGSSSAESASPHLSTRQYTRVVKQRIALMQADQTEYGTHSLRRTKATLIYRKTKNLRAVQILLGHRKIDRTVRYLGIDVDDALEMAEHIER